MQPSEAEISKRIRVLLAEREISATELARRISKSQSYVARRMRGDVAWRAADLTRIAEAMAVPASTLLLTGSAA
jgi:transcriptional regulator with XRE-family HTH domain